MENFIVERPEDDTPDTLMEDREELPDPWILFTDGSSCIDGSRAGLIITNPNGMEFTYALRFKFNATNNEAEYEALLAGLRIAGQMRVQNLQANIDSKLVANQGKVNRRKRVMAVVEEEGHTWMTMHACWTEIRGSKSFKISLQLANYAHGRTKLIRGCSDCQVHRLVPRNPQKKITPITSSWPFYKWGIDIAGHFPEGPGKVKFLIVAMDNFTKWIEARPVATITGAQVKKFVRNNIVYRFGLPGEIVSDNGKQFRDNPFKDWCEKLIIPVEIGMPTLRTTKIDMAKNNEALGINLDLLEQKREQAAIQEARSKDKMARYYNTRVRSTSFSPGDFVYRSNEASHTEDGGKLRPKWEGPYEVAEALGKGAYRLKDRNEKQLPRTWNISNLKKCYVHSM
nr:hypothetical protein [Tanacetum cinerariifolium]